MNRKITLSKPRKDLTVLILVLKAPETITCQKEIQVANKGTESPALSLSGHCPLEEKGGEGQNRAHPDTDSLMNKVLERDFLSHGLSPPLHCVVSVISHGPMAP